jgi:hypothetical protein
MLEIDSLPLDMKEEGREGVLHSDGLPFTTLAYFAW